MTVCERCGTESPAGFRFCGGCGAPLADGSPPRDVRKVVTVLFCDVTGSTAMGERLDPERLRGVMRRYFDAMRAIIERHGGTVEKFIGDAVMAVFGIPVVHEDDALRAVRAAAEIRECLPVLAEETGVALRFRTGVNTGPVLTAEGEALVVGDAVNVAARLEQAAAQGEILLGEETWRLVRDAVEVEPTGGLPLKGKADPVAAHRLLRIDPAAEGRRRRLDAPLVGRGRELGQLRDAFERTVAERACHLFTLLGTAGVGKSRLVAELIGGVGDRAEVLRGRCLHYGEAITFWPLVEALRPVGVPAPLEHGGTGSPEELFWSVRRRLEQLAVHRPVILVMDDLQWAEPMLLDALDHIADLSRGAPILLLCIARSELLEDRPGWAGGKFNASTVLLEPLSEADAEALLGDGLQPADRRRIVSVAGGNPLFIEELGALAREADTRTLPPTVQALIAARLERLPPEERRLLERGAVEGEVFHLGALRALSDEPVAGPIVALVRKDLIRPDAATVAGDEAFRFRHLLIRDAAYEALALETRAGLHERFAAWMEREAAELPETDEIAGWHLEQVVAYRRILDLPVAQQLETRAGRRLAAAGHRALGRGDAVAGVNLLERALGLLTTDDPLRIDAVAELVQALLNLGRAGRADELLAELERRLPEAPMVVLTRGEWLMRTNPAEGLPFLDERLPEIIDVLRRAGDDAGLARAYSAEYWTLWVRSRARDAATANWRAAEHARRAGDRVTRARSLSYVAACLAYGPFPVEEMRRHRVALGEADAGPVLDANLCSLDGEIARMEGRFADARAAFDEFAARLEAFGLRDVALGFDGNRAEVEFDAGRLPESLALLTAAAEHLDRTGEQSYRSTVLARRSDVLERLGRDAEAEADARLAEEVSAPEDVINFAFTRGTLARLRAKAGDMDAALRLAQAAVEFAERTDFPLPTAIARLTYADVLAVTGRRDEAAAQARQALEASEAKGDRPAAEAARRQLERYMQPDGRRPCPADP